ncbi:hypothetical protein HYV64_05400 [Candidatus Shapirobacteria bacterium]|nr:hypothetical protein [Candidatus Shapirobacteria bacterium]
MNKVKASWIISLPYAAVLKVKKGEKVTLGQVLFEGVTETEKVVAMQNQLKGLTSDFIKEINSKNNQKDFQQGDVIIESQGWFSHKITCPESGKFAGIDELLNLHLIVGSEKWRVTSPTEAVVGLITEDELKLEFMAQEYLGRGLNTTKGWVSNGFKKINTLSDINFDCKDRIILVEKMADTVRLKSEVVGVGAIIVLDENNETGDARINFKIPGLAVSREVYDELLKQVGRPDARALVNGNSGRLLLVV